MINYQFLDYSPKPVYTNVQTEIQGVEVIIHTIGTDTVTWWGPLGYMKFEPDDPMFGAARVYSLSPQIPEYQNGDTNWDVGMACIFDY